MAPNGEFPYNPTTLNVWLVSLSTTTTTTTTAKSTAFKQGQLSRNRFKNSKDTTELSIEGNKI
jgi:hypothetical protein